MKLTSEGGHIGLIGHIGKSGGARAAGTVDGAGEHPRHPLLSSLALAL